MLPEFLKHQAALELLNQRGREGDGFIPHLKIGGFPLYPVNGLRAVITGESVEPFRVEVPFPSKEQTRQILGISARSVRRRVRDGGIPSVRVRTMVRIDLYALLSRIEWGWDFLPPQYPAAGAFENQERLFTMESLSRLLQVSPRGIRRERKGGRLQATKVRGSWRFRTPDVVEWLYGEQRSGLLRFA